MNKFVWTPPSKNEIARMVRWHMIVSEYRRKNPDWAIRAIKQFYERCKFEKTALSKSF